MICFLTSDTSAQNAPIFSKLLKKFNIILHQSQ